MNEEQATPYSVMLAPNTREHHIRMALLYLHLSKETIHRDWAFTLLDWASERRALAKQARQSPTQVELFL